MFYDGFLCITGARGIKSAVWSHHWTYPTLVKPYDIQQNLLYHISTAVAIRPFQQFMSNSLIPYVLMTAYDAFVQYSANFFPVVPPVLAR